MSPTRDSEEPESFASAARYAATDYPRLAATSALMAIGCLVDSGPPGRAREVALDATGRLPSCPELWIKRAELDGDQVALTRAFCFDPRLALDAAALEIASIDSAADGASDTIRPRIRDYRDALAGLRGELTALTGVGGAELPENHSISEIGVSGLAALWSEYLDLAACEHELDQAISSATCPQPVSSPSTPIPPASEAPKRAASAGFGQYLKGLWWGFLLGSVLLIVAAVTVLSGRRSTAGVEIAFLVGGILIVEFITFIDDARARATWSAAKLAHEANTRARDAAIAKRRHDEDLVTNANRLNEARERAARRLRERLEETVRGAGAKVLERPRLVPLDP